MFSDQNMNGNISTTKAGLSAGTTTTVTTANTQTWSIGGKAYTKAGTANEAAPTTDANTGAAFTPVGASQVSVFVLCRDASGNLKVAQGSIENLAVDGSIANYPKFPQIPDSLCEIGYLLVKVAAGGANWTFGASNTSGVANTTYTWDDVFFLPFRPQNT